MQGLITGTTHILTVPQPLIYNPPKNAKYSKIQSLLSSVKTWLIYTKITQHLTPSQSTIG